MSEAKYRLISLTLRWGDMEPARHLQVLLPNRRWMVPAKIFANIILYSSWNIWMVPAKIFENIVIYSCSNMWKYSLSLFLSSDNFQALRSTNFSRESFFRRRPRTFFISWLPGFPLMSRTVIWSLGRGPTMPSRWSCPQISIFAKIFALRHIFDIVSPLTEQHLSRFVGRGIAPKKLPGNMKPLSLFSRRKKMRWWNRHWEALFSYWLPAKNTCLRGS